MKRLAVITAMAAATIAVVLVLAKLHLAFILLALGLATAAIARPAVQRLTARGVPLPLALAAAYLAGTLVVVLVAWVVGSELLVEVRRAADALSQSYEALKQRWPHGTGFQRMVAERLPPAPALYHALAPRPLALAAGVVGVLGTALELLGEILLVIVLSVYWNARREAFEGLVLALLPGERRARVQTIWRAVERGVGDHLRSELGQSVLAILVLSLGFHLLGLDYPTLPAVLGGLARFVPLIGGLIAVGAALVAGAATGPNYAVAAALFTLSVLVALEMAVGPRLFHARRLSSLVVTFTVVALAQAYGLAGLLAAPLVAAALQISFEQLFGSEPGAGTGSPADPLEPRVAALRRRLAHAGPPAPELVGIVDRLDALVAAARRSPR